MDIRDFEGIWKWRILVLIVLNLSGAHILFRKRSGSEIGIRYHVCVKFRNIQHHLTQQGFLVEKITINWSLFQLGNNTFLIIRSRRHEKNICWLLSGQITRLDKEVFF